jgi:tRNA (cytidine/uridine-2'-O-)-methyltransferase
MLHVVLCQPEIPPNTGNIIRLCANSGMQLHLVGPLAFELDDKRLRRAGLDYHEWAEVREHDSIDAFSADVEPAGVHAFTTHATRFYTEVRFAPNDALVFGSETRGLPADYLQSLESGQRLRLPMRENSRSMNLSNCVAVVVYEAWRQIGFLGGN